MGYLSWKLGLGIGLALAIIIGLALRPSGRAFRFAAVAINGFFVLWAIIAALRFFRVVPKLPNWTLANVTLLGLVFHLLWCAIAAGLLGLIALLSRWARRDHGTQALQAT